MIYILSLPWTYWFQFSHRSSAPVMFIISLSLCSISSRYPSVSCCQVGGHVCFLRHSTTRS